MLFSGIPRIKLLEEATPIQCLSNIGNIMDNNNIFVKRDDIMPIGMGGNKIRCLEFWLGDAIQRKCDILLVAGASVSNQCRLAAAAAAKIGMDCIILHSSDEPKKLNGNSLLNRLMGVKTIFLGEMDEASRKEYTLNYSENLRKKGFKPYIIGEDLVTGAFGYVSSALELVYQAERENIDLKHVVICGSEGPTETGLIYGLSLFGNAFKVHVISVEYEISYLEKRIQKIFKGMCNKLDLVPPRKIEDVAVLYNDYIGEGYGKTTKESLDAVKLLAQKEGIFIENTYNSKVFAGMFDLIKKGIIPRSEAVCCYITGGTPALFNQANLFD
ncbi:pyridoxal-phosphate dependent enzyme [Maledivibacter halophilus]|uniref:L-cysteate sulfo-lyase n=1 Tax=Maledivibacter halophilus TaxID=36842 RepID=A0A1T5MPI4_9FIRM|nr:pyridoxal-phosphate dependent enzyme [Maledivibacter halophilus]SKC90131.1 L-cysteate sulfo-lyase [Maledivibacter halophilus]